MWSIDGTLTSTIIPDQGGPGSNGNEGVLNILLSKIIGTSPSDSFVSYSGKTLEGVLPRCIDSVSIFYSPSRLGSLLLVILSGIWWGMWSEKKLIIKFSSRIRTSKFWAENLEK